MAKLTEIFEEGTTRKSLSVNTETGELYWDGKAIVTQQTVNLEGWTFVFAGLATLATVVAAVWPIALHFGLFAV